MVLLFDMYGVIIKESKGKFTPYVFSRFPETDKIFFRQLYIKASTGQIDGLEFFSVLGFDDSAAAITDYIENHLTLDVGFVPFAEKYKNRYDFALLSNDVLEWSERIRTYHNIGGYFKEAIISANAFCRKPGRRIYEIALERLGAPARECIFIDNSAENLTVAGEIGMNTVLFNRDGESYDGDTVDDFSGLDELIENKYGGRNDLYASS